MFDSRSLSQDPETKVFEDRYKTVEINTAFKRVRCYSCDFEAVYKYQVQELRRHSEIRTDPEEECVREDHVAIWKAIPRYAEIPETVKCKRCGEVLGLYTECIY